MNSYTPDFDMVAPGSLPEVLPLLAENWRPIAGGTDLMVLLQAGHLPFRKLVSVRALSELRGIRVEDSFVSIGAAVTYSEIRAHHVLQSEFPLLCRAASWTGGIANQNRGTLGGNIANASPAADSLPALLVHEAELELVSLRGTRRIAYKSFHTGYKKMRLELDELLVRIHLPRPRAPWISYARKVGARKAQAISKVGMAAVATLDGDRLNDVRIALASVAPIPVRCVETERALTGNIVSIGRELATQAMSAEIAPIDDIRSTGAYRRQVALNLLNEFLDSVEPLAKWNAAPVEEAQTTLLKCCGSTRWAAHVAASRPFASKARLFSTADEVWRSLSAGDWLEAFHAHPRIGDSTSKTSSWSAQEQAGMNAAVSALREAMSSANREYEARFGFIYIVCATGKTAEEMLSLLEARLANSREQELREAAEQQRQITQLRLRKWLGE
jgi:OHCU decarboxylase